MCAPQALWKGNAPAELLYIVYGAVQFSVYRSLSHALAALPPAFRPPLAAESFAAGAVAGCAATAASYPLDLLRTRFAAQTVSALAYRRGAGSVFAAASRICRDEGVRGFFRGGSAAIGMVGPYMGLFFATYEALHPLLAGLPGALAAAPPHPLTAPLAMLVSPLSSADAAAGIAGTAASVTAKTAVFPLDLVRKRLQVQGPTRAAYAYGNVPEYRGVLSTVRTVVSQQGLRGLYRGLPISLAKAAPTSAITMWTYELTLRYLQ